MTEPEIEVHPDLETLAAQVALRLRQALAQAQAEGRVPALALTGGSVAEAVHQELGRAAVSGDETPAVDWSRVDFWWGDERYVDADSSDRNAGQARAAFLDVVGADAARVHAMPSSDAGHPDVAAAARSYAEQLRTEGTGLFDIVMLGVGPDGHVASLFPGRPELDVDDAVAVPVTDSPKPPPERISLTYGALNRAREVWFLVTTAEKADVVARAVGGADRHEVPASGVHGQEQTRWFLDDAAASRLPAR